jgi:hypothetical protein
MLDVHVTSRLSRRSIMGHAAAAVAATSGAGALLSACGGDDDDASGSCESEKVAFLNVVPLNLRPIPIPAST